MGDVRVLKTRENDRVNPSNDKLSVCVSWLFSPPDTIHSLGGGDHNFLESSTIHTPWQTQSSSTTVKQR